MVHVVTLGNNASSGDRGLNLAELKALAKYKNKSKVEFPDDDYPLKTSNAETQKEISKRIRKHMKEIGLKNKDLAQVWGKSPQTAGRRLKDPGTISFFECELLRERLGCSIEWLRHGGAIDTLSTEELTFLYDGLDQSDRELVSSLVRRLAGEEAIKEMDTVSLGRRTYFYLERHPEETEKMKQASESIRLATSALAKRISKELVAKLAPVQRMADEALRLADELESRGVVRSKVEGMTLDEMREALSGMNVS